MRFIHFENGYLSIVTSHLDKSLTKADHLIRTIQPCFSLSLHSISFDSPNSNPFTERMSSKRKREVEKTTTKKTSSKPVLSSALSPLPSKAPTLSGVTCKPTTICSAVSTSMLSKAPTPSKATTKTNPTQSMNTMIEMNNDIIVQEIVTTDSSKLPQQPIQKEVKAEVEVQL